MDLATWLKAWFDFVSNVAPGLFAACFYGIVSGSMSFMNKVGSTFTSNVTFLPIRL